MASTRANVGSLIVPDDEVELINNCTLQNTQKFELLSGHYPAKVIDVYDGDTVTVALIPTGQKQPFQFRLRIVGIDTPEIRTKDLLQKKMGRFAKEKVHDLLINKMLEVIIEPGSTYGRQLGDVLNVDGEGNSLSQWVLLNNLGKAYGKHQTHREDWTEEELMEMAKYHSVS